MRLARLASEDVVCCDLRAMTDALRLLVYDRTCKKHGLGLSTAWSSGALLYRGLGRLHASRGVASWDEALEWLAAYEPSQPIAEIQYWGHGRWGRVMVGADALDAAATAPGHPRHPALLAIAARLLPDARSLVWLRTCEAFGAETGHDFAARLADALGARVAGHTFIIGAIQSGLRTLAPGCRPTWSTSEGLLEGTPSRPVRAASSLPTSPRTVTCFSNTVPAEWFTEDGRAREKAPRTI
jgi:hypothetical protein